LLQFPGAQATCLTPVLRLFLAHAFSLHPKQPYV
jgi:hypothetical protein